MLLILHVLAAIAGIIMSTYCLVSASSQKIRLSAGLVALTVLSGTIIVLQRHLGLVSACVSGLIYVGFTSASLVAASRRLTD